MKHINLSTPQKVLLSVGVIGVASAMAGLGTFATFTSATSASQPVSSATVTIALGTAGSATNRLTIGASDIVPGDTIERAVDLSNTGNATLASVALTTTAAPSTALTTDVTNGLQMLVQKCSVAWTETSAVAGVAPFTYACSGTTTTLAAPEPVIQTSQSLGSTLASLAPAGVDYLMVELSFPTAAPNADQTLSTSITYTFTGTQRAGTAQ